MNRFSALLGGALIALGLSQGASAADLAVAPAPPPAPSWTGFYIGVHAGAAWQSGSDWNFFDPNGTFFPITLPATGNALGAVGGIQGGYNWQFAPAWVVGIEGDISWSSLSDGRAISNFFVNPQAATVLSNGGAIGIAGNPPVTCPPCSVQMSANTEWLSSVRGRLGFIGWGNTLFYATGGAAWANIEYAATFTGGSLFFNTQGNTSFNTTKAGWVVGGGAEWMATSNILIRAEYLFYDISNGNVRATAPICTTNFGPTACAIVPHVYTWSNYNVQVARVALSYRF
jgi:outer membrane immunogenic protein